MSSPVLQLKSIVKTYHQGRNDLHVLRGVDLEIHPGEIVAMIGPSGAGKSTLLHMAGLLESPDTGTITVAGQACANLGDDERTKLRRHRIGFVYQYHHLLPEFSARENIEVPQIIAGRSRREARDRADQLLETLGLRDRATHRPGRLSGGEQQRVAIARALANGPSLLLADEPTGNLDPDTADDVFSVLISLARGAGLAALIATHNTALAARMDRVVRLMNGVLVRA